MRNEKIIRIIVLSFIFMSLLAFVYSLGFFTDFLPIRSAYRELHDSLQLFNREVFNYALVGLVPAAILFILDNHKTNQYGISNKLIGVIAGGFGLFQAYNVLSQIGGLHNAYSEIDPTKVHVLYPNYQISEVAFTYGYGIFVVLALISIAVILVALVNKKEKETI